MLINFSNLSMFSSFAKTQEEFSVTEIDEEHQAGGFCSDDTQKVDDEYKYFLEVEDKSQIEKLKEEYDLSDKEISVSEELDEKLIVQVDLTSKEAKEVDNIFSEIEVEKNYNVNGRSVTGEDIGYNQKTQWYLDAMDVNCNDDITSDKKVKVELLDSGVSYVSSLENVEHIDLTNEPCGNIIYNDNNGHGTSLAGVINADNGEIKGINPEAQLYSVKVLDENLQAPISKIVEGIYWGIENDMDIINMSFGTTVNSSILYEAIEDASEAGILLIASAGNDNEKGVMYPAAYPQVIAVGSTDNNGNQINEFATGEEVELLAPGTQIISTGEFEGYVSGSGTSISTALVTGVASKLMGKKGATSANIRALLKSTGKSVEGNTQAKLIDYDNALRYFDEFVSDYVQNMDITTVRYKNYTPTETFNTKTIVNGLWNPNTHEYLANKAYENNVDNDDNSLNTTYLECMKYGARKSDAFKSEYMNTYYKKISGGKADEYGGLHGFGAYAVNLKVLWKYANYIKGGNNHSNAYNKAMNSLSEEEKNSFWKVEKPNVDESALPTKHKTEGVLRTAGAFLIYVKEKDEDLQSTNAKKKYLIVGLILHMIGDIYAHRTFVPEYVFANAKENIMNASGNSSDEKSYLRIKDFVEGDDWENEWTNFKLEYGDGKSITFAKINGKIIVEYEKVKARYEDNQDFCRERLNAALKCSNEFVSRASSSERNKATGDIIHQQKNVNLRYYNEYMARLE